MEQIKIILVIEDGNEYEEFAGLFLSDVCEIRAAHSASEALELLAARQVNAFLIDLRFDRAIENELVGDVQATAKRLFAGNMGSALSYLKDNQGVLILAELRKAGHVQPAVFVHEFAPGRLGNLRRLYGDVIAISSFDAAAIRRSLGVET
ncbi:MAG: hypothetical protein GY847_01305 [Proteobacteria bacterium]|nr:hypothetical protein [Pseudomonadota bacterium]